MNLFSTLIRLIRSKKVIAGLCLVVATFTALPMPIVTIQNETAVPGNLAERFPCENSPCGCRSAKHCWTKCCCRTPKQRAEWAKANSVNPPSYAVVKEEATVVASNSPSCSAKKLVKACCSKKDDSTKRSLTMTLSSPAEQQEPEEQELEEQQPDARKKMPRVSIRLTISALVLNCLGQSTDFALMPWTTLVKPEALRLNLPLIDTLDLASDQHPLQVFYDPIVPPPRRAS